MNLFNSLYTDLKLVKDIRSCYDDYLEKLKYHIIQTMDNKNINLHHLISRVRNDLDKLEFDEVEFLRIYHELIKLSINPNEFITIKLTLHKNILIQLLAIKNINLQELLSNNISKIECLSNIVKNINKLILKNNEQKVYLKLYLKELSISYISFVDELVYDIIASINVDNLIQLLIHKLNKIHYRYIKINNEERFLVEKYILNYMLYEVWSIIVSLKENKVYFGSKKNKNSVDIINLDLHKIESILILN